MQCIVFIIWNPLGSSPIWDHPPSAEGAGISCQRIRMSYVICYLTLLPSFRNLISCSTQSKFSAFQLPSTTGHPPTLCNASRNGLSPFFSSCSERKKERERERGTLLPITRIPRRPALSQAISFVRQTIQLPAS